MFSRIIQNIIYYTKLEFILKASAILVLLLVILNFSMNVYSKPFVANQIQTVPDDAKVGLVFGARFLKSGEPSELLKDRLDSAIELYKAHKIHYILLAGESLRSHLSEVDVMEKYCIDRGIPVDKIIVDGAALDTYSTVYRAKYIYKLRNPIFITQDFHLHRALFIGRMLGMDCTGYSADRKVYEDQHKDRMRELVSNVKAVADVALKRVPPYVIKERKPLSL